MNKRELSLQKIQMTSLNILKVIVDICDRLNIDYYVSYGSLIGAVRHKGFIPWDDDLDISMLRNEYEMFAEYCCNNQKKIFPYKMLDYKRTDGYPYCIGRMIDTRYIARFDNEISYGCGAFVDIYPYDGLGDGRDAEKLIRKQIFYKTMLYYSIQDHYIKHPNFAINILKKIIWNHCKKKGYKYYGDKIMSLCKKYNLSQSEYIGLLCWEQDTDKWYKKEWFKGTTQLPFEDMIVKVPIGYKDVLTKQYGDYMKLPPVDLRQPTHSYHLYCADE